MAEALSAFGVTVTHTEPGEHPCIQGPLRGGDVSVDAAGSSQVLTGLLCALAHAEGDSVLNLHGVVSRPYVQMTLEVLEDMGIDIDLLEEDEDARTLLLRVPGHQRAQARDMAIDGDWSAAAFLLGIGALCAPHHLNVEGLHSTYTQADEAIKGALLFGGCRLAGTDEGVQVMAGKPKSFTVDLTDSPDLFPHWLPSRPLAKSQARSRACIGSETRSPTAERSSSPNGPVWASKSTSTNRRTP